MLYEWLKNHLGQTTAPIAAIVLFVVVVGVSIWLTPRIARWIDGRRGKTRGFYDGMMEEPPRKDERK